MTFNGAADIGHGETVAIHYTGYRRKQYRTQQEKEGRGFSSAERCWGEGVKAGRVGR